MRGAVEIEVQRRVTGDGMGSNDRMGNLDELLGWSPRGDAGREHVAVVVGVHREQAEQALLLHRLEEPVRGSHVDECGVAAQLEVAELCAYLVGEDETGVDDLAIFAVAQDSSVARPTDGDLDRPDHRCQRAPRAFPEASRLLSHPADRCRDRNLRPQPRRALHAVRARSSSVWQSPVRRDPPAIRSHPRPRRLSCGGAPP